VGIKKAPSRMKHLLLHEGRGPYFLNPADKIPLPWRLMPLPCTPCLPREILAHGRQKPVCTHFVAGIFSKIPTEPLIHFIR
jgi:hypothetical protein